MVLIVMWYKAWKAIQDGHARTTPGKAIGFLFIPFFNFYWIFQSLWGFAKDYNSYISRHRISSPELPSGLFLAYCILSLGGNLGGAWLSWMPILGVIVSLLTFIILLIIVNKVCDAVNNLSQPTEA